MVVEKKYFDEYFGWDDIGIINIFYFYRKKILQGHMIRLLIFGQFAKSYVEFAYSP